MTLPDRHDHEVAAHHRREEAAQARRDELTKTAIDNLTERFWKSFEEGGEAFRDFYLDTLAVVPQPTKIRHSAAHQTGDRCELGLVHAQVLDLALAEYIDHYERREIDRLMEAA